MRLEPLPPDSLAPDVRALHDTIVKRMDKSLSAFVSRDERGALIGPFPPLLHFPKFGKTAFAFLDGLVADPHLPPSVREVVILTVGARFNAAYELYSHGKMAEKAGLSDSTISALAAGQRPSEFDEREAIAHDMAAALMRQGPVPNSTYDRAVNAFGSDGVGELVFLAAGYAVICILLNAFQTTTPESS